MQSRKRTMVFLTTLFSCLIIAATLNSVIAVEETSLDRYFTVTTEAQGSGAIGSEVSAVGVSSFKNMGLYGHTDDTLVYWASVRLNVKANVWTLAELEKVNYQDRTINWLTLYTHTCWWNKLDYKTSEYSLTSHDIASYTVSEATVKGLRVNVEYTPPDAKQLTFSGQNVTATLPVTTFHFDRYIVENSTKGDLATYTDRYVNLRDGATGVGVVNVGRPEDSQFNEALYAWNSKLKELELGVVAGDVVEGLTPDPTRVGKIQTPSAGSTMFVKEGPAASFTVPVSITPRVTEARQHISVRDAEAWIDTLSDTWFCACGAATVENVGPVSNARSFTRTVGVHVDNYYVQTSLFVDGYVFSSVQLSVPLTETFLEKPEVIKGDYVWDLTLGGATKVDLGFTTAQNVVADWLTEWTSFFTTWGPQILGLVVLAVVIVVLIRSFPQITSYITRKVQHKAGNW